MKLPLLLAAALLLAGCMGKPDPSGDEPAAQTGAADGEGISSAAAPEATPASPTPAAPARSNATASGPPPPAPAPDAAPPAPPRVDVARWNGSISGAGLSPPAGPACCVWRTPDNTPGEFGAFEVPAGLRGILVELAWTDAMADLDLQVLAADYEETVPPEPNGPETSFHRGHAWSATQGAPGQPDGYARILLVEEDPLALAGGWSWRVGAKAAQETPFTVAVSLYYDTTPDADATALGSTSGNP